MLNRRLLAPAVLLASALALTACTSDTPGPGPAPDPTSSSTVAQTQEPAPGTTEHVTKSVTLWAPDTITPDPTVPDDAELGLSFESDTTRAALAVVSTTQAELSDRDATDGSNLKDVAELGIASMTNFAAEDYESAPFELEGADEAHLARVVDQPVNDARANVSGFALAIRDGENIILVMAAGTKDFEQIDQLLAVPETVTLN